MTRAARLVTTLQACLKPSTIVDRREKNCAHKPAARRSGCVGKLGLPLQTGRGAAFKLVLLGEFDQQSIEPHQLPWSLSLLANAKGTAIAVTTVPAVM